MNSVFGIIPASSGPFIFILIISVILIAVISLFIFISYSTRHVSFEVNENGLKIGPALYGRFIPREDIAARDVRVMNLDEDVEYQPKSRTNGVGLPGYAEGADVGECTLPDGETPTACIRPFANTSDMTIGPGVANFESSWGEVKARF